MPKKAFLCFDGRVQVRLRSVAAPRMTTLGSHSCLRAEPRSSFLQAAVRSVSAAGVVTDTLKYQGELGDRGRAEATLRSANRFMGIEVYLGSRNSPRLG